jgi:hypothetical protein
MIIRILAFIITNIMATTLVFAEHTKASLNSDLSKVFNAYSDITDGARTKSNKCSKRNINKLVGKIDARIENANTTNETLDQSIAKELSRYSQVRKAQIKMTKKILRKNRRINRTYKKVRKSNPELTKSDFVQKLKSSITKEMTATRINSIIMALTQAGSMTNYLIDMKDKVINCDYASMKVKGFDVAWIWIILFVGLPVIALIVALFSLLFGAFWLALGLFAYTVTGLLIYFIWANVTRFNPTNEIEVTPN